MTFQIKLADICIRVISIYDDVYDYCSDYIDDNSEPEFTIELGLFDVEEEAKKECNSKHSLPYIETLVLYRKISESLLDKNILLMHGSVVAVGKNGVMFTAPSGTGKTTHSNLWLEHFQDSYIVNGDKPLLKIEDTLYAYGTPWAGKERFQKNCKVPLAAIVFLRRAENNSIRRLAPNEVVSHLLKQVYLPYEGERLCKTMNLIGTMVRKTAFFEMNCNNFKDDAVKIALGELGPLLGVTS